MINPKAELFKWGPIDGFPCYADDFMQPMAGYEKLFPPGWPDIIAYYQNGKTTCISDYAALRKNGAELFRKYILNDAERKKCYAHWRSVVDSLVHQMKEWDGIELEKLGKGDTHRLFTQFIDIYREFWRYGFLPELANYSGEQLLKEALLKDHQDNFLLLFERLSAPEELSFFQKEELELLKIAKDGVKKDKLEAHQEKYFWLRNSYGHTEVLDTTFFQERTKSLSQETIRTKITEMEAFSIRAKEEKKRVIHEFRISDDITNLGRQLGFCVWWQDLRKKYIFMANHYLTRFMQDFAQRFSIPLEELYYLYSEGANVLKA